MKADLCISKRISKRSIAEPLHVYMYINRARLCVMDGPISERNINSLQYSHSHLRSSLTDYTLSLLKFN